jgi:processive 1,2-diacylglycerol beta-glucosyltransferase
LRGAGLNVRVLLLSVSAGAGHVRAAQALAAHAALDFPQLDVCHVDVMTLVPGWFRKVYSDWYMKLASGLPEAWGWLYRKTDHEPGGSLPERARRLVQRLCARRLFDEVARYRPDVIVCTHFLPAEILATAHLRGEIDAPVWVQVTDFDLHQMWLHEGTAGYFVANEELGWRLQALGVPASRAVISGIPVMPGFTNRPDRGNAAARFALDPTRMTVLMMGGGGGLGLDASLIRQLLEQHPDLQLVVMCGRNQTLLATLQQLRGHFTDRLVPLGFTDEVPALMACADLAITKPGGLSTSECLVSGLPMLLVNPIPGQEERNAAWLMQEGVALRADDPVTLQFRLARLLQDRSALARMRAKALSLAAPQAAQTLLQRITH